MIWRYHPFSKSYKNHQLLSFLVVHVNICSFAVVAKIRLDGCNQILNSKTRVSSCILEENLHNDKYDNESSRVNNTTFPLEPASLTSLQQKEIKMFLFVGAVSSGSYIWWVLIYQKPKEYLKLVCSLQLSTNF